MEVVPSQERATIGDIESGTSGRQRAASGAGMDRAVAKRSWLRRHLGALILAVLVVLGIAWWLWSTPTGRSLTLNDSRIVVSPVTQGVFEDFVPIRSRVTPRRTVFLDAIEGGRVERKLVEDGALVEAGELIVVLSNTSLQLSVTQNEAMVTEQLNNMRTIELQLEQNRLQHKRNLVELDYQIKRLERQIARFESLDNAGVAIKSQLEDAQDELQYFRNRREVTLESQATDARLQETQLAFLQKTGGQLEENLAFARQNLDALNVTAPVAGKLSGLDLEVGQSIQRGGRLGQVDDPQNFKLRASVDEYYLRRVDLGQSAVYETGGRRYPLSVSKIYPQVNNGQFEIDLQFQGEQPDGIRRGQTMQTRLTLGDATDARLIPNGAFYADTGGQWIFVVNDAGTEAVRRSVRLGRRNSRYIEVLDGLEVGEEVVTSPYTNYREVDRLNLTAN
ncbi:MAG: efflux RND transporter periplasmic adaptor subunit [Pseudomonadota bacterium]